MATTPSSTTASKDDSGGNNSDTNVASTDAPVSTSASLVGSFRRAREYFAPVRAKSAFLSKGVLTPDEFVRAGDELVHRCPTWCWESGDPTKHKSFLPPDKQFLITRGVPSTARVDSIEQALTLTALHDDDGGDDGEDDWLVSSIAPPQEKSRKKSSDDDDDDDELEDIEDDFDILDINEDGEVVETKKQDKKGEVAPAPPATASAAVAPPPVEDYPEDEEYADMADFEDDNILVDDAAADVAGGTMDVASASSSAAGTSTATTMIAGGTGAGAGTGGGKTVPTRRYDISITYDKYYQTPRVWMTGFNEHQQPLSVEELMEDVVSDYRHKTVTMEPHPHSSGRQASIHPCQHAKVMKVIVQNLIKASGSNSSSGDDDDDDGSGEDTVPAVDVTQYLFIFLKFVSSIIPTVNYDFTMNVEASTSK
eukprot:CAMPEP_0113482214 /NCGR_PEP_ID=MMETSP0014_2-20120614/22804_1 /TAXON_ID=2857 /ORGANISM="Nitzschia sp." /LENGTH=423 /DNA_ID=CAMNT_0000375725 /DNA_START=66 /DNA_END=1337 /DNA_ORIENTATION=- /assembly_acc=CAM_ASM_000159